MVTTYEYKVKAGSPDPVGDLRQVSYNDGTPTTTCTYDHLGRRFRKTYFTHNGTTWVVQRDTAYPYVSWNMVAD